MNNGASTGYSFHVATPKYQRIFTFVVNGFFHNGDESINFNLNAEQYFKDPNTLSLKTDGDLSHSGSSDALMDKFIANTYNLFEFTSVDTALQEITEHLSSGEKVDNTLYVALYINPIKNH